MQVKSNKIGQTTSALLEDFQTALLPETAGGDILVGAQDQAFANSHIMDLKMMIKNSKKYSQFLIENPEKELLKEMKSKISVAYIRNPYDYKRPSRIIGIGQNPSRTFSWRNVVHVHLSDISMIVRKDWQEYFRGIYTRMANTEGKIKIESIPKGQQGLIYYLHQQITGSEQVDEIDDEIIDESPTFSMMKTDYTRAVDEGVMSQEFINRARRDLSKMEFASAFECVFTVPGNQWYGTEMLKSSGYGI